MTLFSQHVVVSLPNIDAVVKLHIYLSAPSTMLARHTAQDLLILILPNGYKKMFKVQDTIKKKQFKRTV